MSSVRPNNNPSILVNEFIRMAKQHLLTVEGLALCQSTYSPNGTPGPGFCDWKGYVCDPESPGGIEQIVKVLNSEFNPNRPISIVELENYKEDLDEKYSTLYPKEVEGAPIYGNVKNINYGNTPNTSFVATGLEARQVAENYLGRSMEDAEWSNLISCTYAEAGPNQTEIAYVAASILNRVRIKYTPLGPANKKYNFETVTDIIWQWRQFESVTGNPTNGNQPSRNFLQGPPRSSEISIYGSIKNILVSVDKKITDFTSNNDCLYVECNPPKKGLNDVKYVNGKVIRILGRNYDYLLNMRKRPTAKIIGSSIFSD